MPFRLRRGRQRIPIQRIESQDDMYATFSKRRLGLFKKASELCTLCGVDIGIIMFSPTGTPHSFFSPTMESVIERFNNPSVPQSDHLVAIDAVSRVRINELNRELEELSAQREAEEQRTKVLLEQDKDRPKGWWEEIPVKEMNKEQVDLLKAWFEDLLARGRAREEELRNGAGTSSYVPNVEEGMAHAPGLENDEANAFNRDEFYRTLPSSSYWPRDDTNEAGPSNQMDISP